MLRIAGPGRPFWHSEGRPVHGEAGHPHCVVNPGVIDVVWVRTPRALEHCRRVLRRSGGGNGSPARAFPLGAMPDSDKLTPAWGPEKQRPARHLVAASLLCAGRCKKRPTAGDGRSTVMPATGGHRHTILCPEIRTKEPVVYHGPGGRRTAKCGSIFTAIQHGDTTVAQL